MRSKLFGSTCHRRFQEWVRLGMFKKMWIKLLKEHDDKKGIKRAWQSLDSMSVKSPLGGRRPQEAIPPLTEGTGHKKACFNGLKRHSHFRPL
jgi:hypothetical protein